MPSTKSYGTPGASNEKIGGVPVLHYFDFQSRGRGQVIRLLWEDAGIAYNDIRYSFEEYPKYKATKISELNPTTNIPVIELNGRILTQSYAILRHFARQLGKYDGQTEEEKYWADAMCDIVVDWRTLFITAFFSENKDTTYPQHCKGNRVRFLKAMNTHLSSHDASRSGPFIIGANVTYADLVLYQLLHDEQLTQDGRAGLKEYPRLKELVDAIENRPNIKAFLGSERYLG
ncbi:glutathione S-transferase [Lophium mytilinum]|uniref:Glutathione S-transferase n=1 Tax=Lophium mytilinum TaxID=390894 RepID=A0A6A6QZ11_9PEZI|nr:glutathione S-transferase [Lophium mytilinum]